MQIRITVDQGKRLFQAFAAYPEIVAPFLRDASSKSAFTIEGHAKTFSPVDTGRMRASIATSLGIRDLGITSIVQTNVFYAIFVHEGTKRMRGRPFMQQGVDRSIPEIQGYYRTAMNATMQKIRGMAQ